MTHANKHVSSIPGRKGLMWLKIKSVSKRTLSLRNIMAEKVSLEHCDIKQPPLTRGNKTRWTLENVPEIQLWLRWVLELENRQRGAVIPQLREGLVGRPHRPLWSSLQMEEFTPQLYTPTNYTALQGWSAKIL